MALDFSAVVRRLMESSGDGWGYIVGESYKHSAELFDKFNSDNGLGFSRSDYDESIVFHRPYEESVIFTKGLTDKERTTATLDGDAIWEIEDGS